VGRTNDPGWVKHVARDEFLLTCVGPHQLIDGPLIRVIQTLFHSILVKELLQGLRKVAPGMIAEWFLILILLDFD
jgi:hypothetical protein